MRFATIPCCGSCQPTLVDQFTISTAPSCHDVSDYFTQTLAELGVSCPGCLTCYKWRIRQQDNDLNIGGWNVPDGTTPDDQCDPVYGGVVDSGGLLVPCFLGETMSDGLQNIDPLSCSDANPYNTYLCKDSPGHYSVCVTSLGGGMPTFLYLELGCCDGSGGLTWPS